MSETPGDTPIDRRADRYGTTPRPTRRWITFALGVVVLAAGLGVAYLGFRTYGPKDIDPEQLGYTVVDDSTISVHFKVTRKDSQQPAVCFVRAMARDGSELGRREVLIAPSDSGTIELTTIVRASARPVSSSIYGCSHDVPKYLRAG